MASDRFDAPTQWAPPTVPRPPSEVRPATPPNIFISYRRTETLPFVDELDERLRADLGTERVYRDLTKQLPGEDYESRIVEEIAGADAVVVVMGPRWESVMTAGASTPRILESDDLVRREVAAALDESHRAHPDSAVPVLVDRTEPPARSSVPDELAPILKRTCVSTSAGEISSADSPDYQGILVGVWLARRRAVPNGVVMFGGDTPTARAALDDLAEQLRAHGVIDLTEFTQYACNARVVSRRKARRLARHYPDVVAVIDESTAGDPVLAARISESKRRGLRVAVVTIGGAISLASGVASGSGALEAMTPEMLDAVSGLKSSQISRRGVRLFSWHATVPTATKLAVAAVTVAATATGAGIVYEAVTDPTEPEVPLAGDWDVGTFSLDATEGTQEGAFGPIPGGLTSFEPADPDCADTSCRLVASRGPGFLLGAELAPNDEGDYDIDFAVDEAETIRAMTDGGIVCLEDNSDQTDRADLDFGVVVDDVTGDLEFLAIVAVPPSDACPNPGRLEWSASARRLPSG